MSLVHKAQPLSGGGLSVVSQMIFTSSPADIKAVLPDIYDKLTTNDFIVGMSNSTATVGSPNTGTYTAYSYTVNCGKTLSYNAEEGKLTFGYTRGHCAPNQWSSTFLDANGVFAVWRGTINGVVPS